MAATRAQTDGPPAGAKCKVKLPKHELQRFSGAATEWQSFWEQFEQAVHGNDGLSNAEKFLCLRSVLSEKAAAAIAGIQVTGANYTTVIELLKERFGRRDVLIQEHLTQLLDLPTVQNEKEHIGLRRLYDHLQRNIAGLTALGVKTDSYGALLSSALLRMLPTDLVVGYHKGLSAASRDDAISIKSLQAFLKTEVESREKALQPVKKLQGALVAVKTEFGWTLQGAIPSSSSAAYCSTVAVLRAGVFADTTSLSKELKSFWELESIGIIDSSAQTNEESEEVMSTFSASLEKMDTRYEVALPWKPLNMQLADNKAVAKKRLTNLTKKLMKDESTLIKYDEAIRQYLEQGFAERLPSQESNNDVSRLYYMPHRAVFRPDSLSTKIRVVFDASSHDAGCISLNEALEPGPNLNPDLLKVLLNFRIHRIGLSADIEKAFLQISVQPADRDALRFLWYAHLPTMEDPEPPIEVWRMTRVPFGVTSSPFLLAATVRHHLSTTEGYPEIRKTISESLYVDDLITGANTVEEATDLYRGALDVMNRASMTLRKWNSNSKKLQQLFNDEGTGCALGYVECPTTSVSRVLGLVWDKDRDHLAFSMEAILDFLDRNSITKRFILQASARIYDPLGLISPVTVTTKLMFQTLWELGIEWDAPLPEEVKAGWTQWHTQLHHLTDITVPRRYGSLANDSWKEVHIFTDTSPRAYGAVVYLRISGVKEAKVTLVLSKSRVAPIKRISLPRLELMGMVIGARLREYLERSLTLSISRWYLWTDSSIALHWVRGPAQQWKPFVANRVLEIQQRSDPDIWNHCSGIENPADLLTRGVTPQVLKSSSLWWNGPAWLSKPSTCWPRHEGTADMIIAEEERRTLRVHNVTVKESVLPLQKYSSLSRLVRVTAWVLRFFHNAMHPGQKYEGPITTEEVQKAHTCLILQVQFEAFQEELQCLRRSTRMPSDSPIRDLSVIYDDDGVLRVGGRLNAAELSYNVKHPVILPSRHPYTELTISAAHRRLLHAGALETLTELREMYWIVRGRQMVKKVLKKCVTCNRFNSRAATEPVAPLPRERVTQAPPFDVTGADFAGPLNTKDQGNNRKSYIVIFTCAVTRAIHLELVTDMSTSNFLMAFRRFISRRGVCRVIFSDNARTFQRASKDLKRLWTTIRGE
ncbi:uncharacterized protein LOC142591457 [Dermacentor variabilis]|uniref:uncharacterized protein LOC142591457 n=1 Tax=Dermacentor variabilis TaxID=34621 RepID=UPI003F5BDC33